MAIQLFDTYQTDGSANVITLSVHIGNAQQGSTGLLLNGIPKVVLPPADVNGNYRDGFAIPLDTNANLLTQVLEIVTKVQILMLPPASSVTIVLAGGPGPRTYNMDDPGTGIAVGDVVDYYAAITFI